MTSPEFTPKSLYKTKMTLESLSRPDVSAVSQEGVKTDQTTEITNIVELLRKDQYHPPTEYAPHGKVLCPDGEWRHIIGHDTSIDKGVHVSYGLQQNIVVDFDSDEVLQTCYKYAAPALEDMDSIGAQPTLEHLSRLTGSFLPYNEQKVIDYLRESNQKPDGEFQKLGDFVRMGVKDGRIAGAGICLHQALLCGGILEYAIKQKAVSGRVAVFRNHDFEAKSAHAWVVYQDAQDEVWIVDPANSSVTHLTDADNAPWRYGLAGTDVNVG